MAAAGAALLVGETILLSVGHPARLYAKILLCAVAACVLGSILVVMVLTGAIDTRWKPSPGLMISEFESAKAKALSRIFSEKMAGMNLLFVTADILPGMTAQESDAALLSLIKEFGRQMDAVVVEKIPTAVVKGNVQLKFNASAFDKIIAAHPDCPVALSLVGLPGDYRKMSSLASEEGPAFILVNQFHYLAPADLARLLGEGRIAACVTPKPGWLHRWRRSPVMPSTPEKAFQLRFDLKTRGKRQVRGGVTS